MLKRCYSKTRDIKHPSYKECLVCDEWLLFSNFRRWVIEQEQLHGSLVGMQLDKDIIEPSNKMYCPDKCAFVSVKVNSFVLESNASRGVCPIGVIKQDNRYKSQCQNPFKRGKVYLGRHDTPEEAHEAWREQKHIFACLLADTCKDDRVAHSLRNRYNATN